jgi:hypothetical protein
MPPATTEHIAFLTAVSEVGARVDTLGERVFEKLDGIREETGKLSERMATFEEWGKHQQATQTRWWDKTWPDHLVALNDALKAHGTRIEALEKDRAALARIEVLDKVVKDQQEIITKLRDFQTRVKVYVAVMSGLCGVLGTALAETLFGYFLHRR